MFPCLQQDTLRKQVLDQLINKKLQLDLADQMGVKLTDEDVDKIINDIAQSNKLTVSQLYQKTDRARHRILRISQRNP